MNKLYWWICVPEDNSFVGVVDGTDIDHAYINFMKMYGQPPISLQQSNVNLTPDSDGIWAGVTLPGQPISNPHLSIRITK